jgi:hypothetical protein
MPNTVYANKGDTARFSLSLKNSDGTAVNLTGYTITSNLTDQIGNNIASFTVAITNAALGTFTLTLSASTTATLNTQNNYYSFDIKLVASNSEVTHLPIIYLTCKPTITP